MPVTPTPLAGLGSGTAKLTETILLMPGKLTALATATPRSFPPSAQAPLKITLASNITPVAPPPPRRSRTHGRCLTCWHGSCCDVPRDVEPERDEARTQIGPPSVGFGGPQPTIVFNQTDEPKAGTLHPHIDVNATTGNTTMRPERSLAAAPAESTLGRPAESHGVCSLTLKVTNCPLNGGYQRCSRSIPRRPFIGKAGRIDSAAERAHRGTERTSISLTVRYRSEGGRSRTRQ
jgi:hypothetical protein